MAALLKLLLLFVLVCLVSAEETNLRKKLIVNPYKCKPGERYYLDCNSCVCIGNGSAHCTAMACGNLKPDKCIPGSVFEVAGQLCKCPKCGYKWHSECFAENYCLN